MYTCIHLLVYSVNVYVMVFGLETPRPQANDHHLCVSAPSETTLVWFYYYTR
jgi:hypothetical protein